MQTQIISQRKSPTKALGSHITGAHMPKYQRTTIQVVRSETPMEGSQTRPTMREKQRPAQKIETIEMITTRKESKNQEIQFCFLDHNQQQKSDAMRRRATGIVHLEDSTREITANFEGHNRQKKNAIFLFFFAVA